MTWLWRQILVLVVGLSAGCASADYHVLVDVGPEPMLLPCARIASVGGPQGPEVVFRILDDAGLLPQARVFDGIEGAPIFDSDGQCFYISRIIGDHEQALVGARPLEALADTLRLGRRHHAVGGEDDGTDLEHEVAPMPGSAVALCRWYGDWVRGDVGTLALCDGSGGGVVVPAARDTGIGWRGLGACQYVIVERKTMALGEYGEGMEGRVMPLWRPGRVLGTAEWETSAGVYVDLTHVPVLVTMDCRVMTAGGGETSGTVYIPRNEDMNAAIRDVAAIAVAVAGLNRPGVALVELDVDGERYEFDVRGRASPRDRRHLGYVIAAEVARRATGAEEHVRLAVREVFEN